MVGCPTLPYPKNSNPPLEGTGAQAGEWPAAQRLAAALQAAGMQPAAAPEMARALCAAVSQRLAPRLAALCPDGPRGRSAADKRVRPCCRARFW